MAAKINLPDGGRHIPSSPVDGAQARSDLTDDRMVEQIAMELARHLIAWPVARDEFGDVDLETALGDLMGADKARPFIKRIATEAARMAIYYRDHPIKSRGKP